MASIEQRPEQGQRWCDTLTRAEYDVARIHERERLGLSTERLPEAGSWWYRDKE